MLGTSTPQGIKTNQNKHNPTTEYFQENNFMEYNNLGKATNFYNIEKSLMYISSTLKQSNVFTPCSRHALCRILSTLLLEFLFSLLLYK